MVLITVWGWSLGLGILTWEALDTEPKENRDKRHSILSSGGGKQKRVNVFIQRGVGGGSKGGWR